MNSCVNNNFNLNYNVFENLGDNNPEHLSDPDFPLRTMEAEIEYLLKRKIIFHDQEPILFNGFKKEWDLKIALMNRLETNHILSNSEINSSEKNELLDKSGWHDFYWFSNGFLSLEWYRYYRYAGYLEHNWNPTKTFSSYNRILRDREHRLTVATHLYNNYKDKIILSCHSDQLDFKLDNLFINTSNDISANLSYKIDVNDFIDSFCHIVTERIFYEDRIHLTEKSFRPIICCRPFILVSSPNSLRYLKNYGFKTFNDFWSEDYDLIEDHSQRLAEVLKIIDYLGSLSQAEILNMLSKMRDILLFNRQHFYNLFQKKITKELFDNLNLALTARRNDKVPIFETTIANLTEAEIRLIENLEDNFDLSCTKEDYFQKDTITKALNNEFTKTGITEDTVRPLVLRYLKHFKYHYLCVKGIV